MSKLSKKEQEQILEVAKQHIFQIADRGDMETRHSDGEDFMDIAVWCLKDALEAAYKLGRNNGQA